MKTKTYLLFLSMLCVCLCAPLTVKGQVKIGGSDTPAQGAVLDLNGPYSGGLLLPNVFIADVEFIPASFTDADKMTGFDPATGVDANTDLVGMVVYNTNYDVADGVGVYVWNGDTWRIVSSGDSSPEEGNFTGEKNLSVGIEGGVVSGGGKDLNWGDKPGYYKFALIENAGGGATLTSSDPATGEFVVTFVENETGANLRAIVRVTSPSRAYQDYTLNQTGTPPVVIPETRGTGSLSGRYIYDVAMTKNGANCGELSPRQSRRPDFTVPQIYTFTGTGSISEVRVTTEEFGDAVGKIFDGEPSVSGSGRNRTISVSMKTSLLDDARGRKNNRVLKGRIIVVYLQGSNEVYASKDIIIQDCVSCGAAIDNKGGWLEFMCHDLGADTSLDPFTLALGLSGNKYQFGVASPVLSAAQDKSQTGAISGWINEPMTSLLDWDTDRENPCPTGWTIPSEEQLEAVIENNILTSVGPFNPTGGGGFMVGEFILLNNSGMRDAGNGRLDNTRGRVGVYWTKTMGLNANLGAMGYGRSLRFGSHLGNGYVMNTPFFWGELKTSGASVRCVAE